MNDFAANEEDVSEDVLEVAILLTQTVDGDGYAELSQSIAIQLAERGDLQRALDVAETIADPFLRDQTLGNIATMSVDLNEDEATELLTAIEDPVLRDLAVEQLAIRYAEMGNTEKSLEMAFRLPDSDPALASIGHTLATKGFEVQAQEIIESIQSPVARIGVLSQIFAEFLKQEKTAEAAHILESAEGELAEALFPEDRINGALIIATMLTDLARRDEAFKELSEAAKLCKEFEDSNNEDTDTEFVRDDALAQLASQMARIGHVAEADALTEEIGEAFPFARATVQLALAQHKAGNTDESLKLLQQAREITDEQPTYGEYGSRLRDALFAEIAAAFANCDHYDQALEIASSVTNADERLRALIRVGQIAAESQQPSVVAKAAEHLQDDVSKSSYWLSVGETLRTAGQFEAFDDAAAHASDCAERIEMPYDRSLLLAEIGFRLAERSKEKSDSIFVRTVQDLPSIESGYRKVVTLLSLAQKYWKLDRKPAGDERAVLRDLVAGLD
jgi:tetratricopeptide (TPR) repeat protein